MGKTKHTRPACLSRLHLNSHLCYQFYLNWLKPTKQNKKTKTKNTRSKSKNKQTKQRQQNNKSKNKARRLHVIDRNHLFLCNANVRYCLVSEQRCVQQASWCTENRAITLLVRLLPQHGTIHGDFVNIWEQTLQWSNPRMKTNLFTTCLGILVALTMDGLDCIGRKLIRNFIGLMAALQREIIGSGTKANQATVTPRLSGEL